MCKTRWSEQDVVYEHFYLVIPFLAEALEVILGTHTDLDQLCSDFTNGWDTKTKKEASLFLNALSYHIRIPNQDHKFVPFTSQ